MYILSLDKISLWLYPGIQSEDATQCVVRPSRLEACIVIVHRKGRVAWGLRLPEQLQLQYLPSTKASLFLGPGTEGSFQLSWAPYELRQSWEATRPGQHPCDHTKLGAAD